MEIAKILLSKSIDINYNKEDKKYVLKRIAHLAKQNPILENIAEEEIYKSLSKREEIGSTAISPRIAIPHCRMKGIDNFVMGLYISKEGINFEAIDKKETFVFAFIIAPENQQKKHVQLLSYISQYLRKEENVSRLINAKEKETIRTSIIRHSVVHKDIKQTDKYKLVTIIIQDEDKFADILNVITELEGSNIAITEASNAGRYLYHMPLFSSFMQTDRNDFCRIITAGVESKDIDELTNNLNNIIAEKNNIIFFIQQIEYSQGSLEI